MEIGRTIRRIRMRKGMKAGELARRLDVSKSYISRIEREQRRINTDLLERIGEVLGVPPGLILNGGRENEAQRYKEELEQLRFLLLEDRILNPSLIELVLGWLSQEMLPEDGTFDSADNWELRFQDELAGSDEAFRSLLQTFYEELSEIVPLNPRPGVSYERFRDSTLASLSGISGCEKSRIARKILPSLLRCQDRWPPPLKKEAVLLPRPGASAALADPAVRLTRLDQPSDGEEGPATVEILPAPEFEHLRAAVIEDGAMSPKYEPGDVVICSTARTAKNGDRAVIGLVEGGWTCRIYRKRGRLVQLTPLNPLHEPLFLKPEEIAWAYPVVRSFSD